MDEHHSWYNGSVWHINWPYQVYVGQWPIFYGPAILLHILKTIWWRNVVLGIMDQCNSKINLVKYMWISDLYFMVHWFCLISLPIHARSPGGGKISWYFHRSYGLREGMLISRILNKSIFLISGTFGSFWDVAAENKPILWEGTIWVAWHISKLTPS